MAERPRPPLLQSGSLHSLEPGTAPLVRQTSREPTPVALNSFGLLKPPESHPPTPIAVLKELAIPLAPKIDAEESDHATTGGREIVELTWSAWFQRLLSFTGPGWLMSIAYVDPGNLEADLQIGAQFGYKLLWALLASTTVGLGMQLVAARLGCATKRHLAEHCRDAFGRPLRLLLWERSGTRPLELFFGALILTLALSMGRLFLVISPDNVAVFEGLTIPQLPPNSLQQVVGMVGCVIMPHNLFLHSALEGIGLANAGHYLGDAFGSTMRIVWALGLCAAGQSSTMTGAYAGQWVMQGYLQLKVPPIKRALITRSMALVPCLLVAFYFRDRRDGLDVLNGYLNVLQSVVLPFAAVPLLSFAGSERIMGRLALSFSAKALAWLATSLTICANIYLALQQLEGENLGVTCSICFVYLTLVVYVAWKALEASK
eukprot:g463.t1